MAGKYVPVTGGTGGIGKATATGLAAPGARIASPAVIRAAPRLPRPISAPQRATTPWTSLPPACPPRRRRAVWPLSYLAPTRGWTDVLVNNADGFWARQHVAADGLEHTFALNHLAPFLLTSLLLDRLAASAPPGSSPSPPVPTPRAGWTSMTCKDRARLGHHRARPGARQPGRPPALGPQGRPHSGVPGDVRL
jgi:NAD(P)-dependent dehydrogenase (short-subunit alcohol dehydrogenase family)